MQDRSEYSWRHAKSFDLEHENHPSKSRQMRIASGAGEGGEAEAVMVALATEATERENHPSKTRQMGLASKSELTD